VSPCSFYNFSNSIRFASTFPVPQPVSCSAVCAGGLLATQVTPQTTLHSTCPQVALSPQVLISPRPELMKRGNIFRALITSGGRPPTTATRRRSWSNTDPGARNTLREFVGIPAVPAQTNLSRGSSLWESVAPRARRPSLSERASRHTFRESLGQGAGTSYIARPRHLAHAGQRQVPTTAFKSRFRVFPSSVKCAITKSPISLILSIVSSLGSNSLSRSCSLLSDSVGVLDDRCSAI
jgi:hypothetical protein